MLQNFSLSFLLLVWHTQTEIVISKAAQWPNWVLLSQFVLNYPEDAANIIESRAMVGRWGCLWCDREIESEKAGKTKLFLSLMPSKGLPVTVLCHREFIEASSHLAWVGFIVQFIGLATWSVRANPVTAQQKAKLRGVRGCRTGRLTGWLTLFPKRIASCQSPSCHLDRNPFFGCNPHRLPFCHSGPHRDTHISSFLSILQRANKSPMVRTHTATCMYTELL